MESLIADLRQAMIAGHYAETRRLNSRLLGEVARALQEQDRERLAALNAAFADLAPLADHHDTVAAGEQWRSLGRILRGLVKAGMPLREMLAIRGQLEDRVLDQLSETPGARPGELAEALGKSRSHLSNLLDRLEMKGLVFRQGRDEKRKPVRVYLSPAAESMLALGGKVAGGQASAASPGNVVMMADFRSPYADPKRLPPASERFHLPRIQA